MPTLSIVSTHIWVVSANIYTHPKDVHPYPIQAVGQNEYVGGRGVRSLAEVEDHNYTLQGKDLTDRLKTKEKTSINGKYLNNFS